MFEVEVEVCSCLRGKEKDTLPSDGKKDGRMVERELRRKVESFKNRKKRKKRHLERARSGT